jgi:hypothetical protein
MGSRRLTLTFVAALFLGLGLAPLVVMFAPD